MDNAGYNENQDRQSERSEFLDILLEKMKRILNVEDLDEETSRMIKRIVVLRVATKHINLWTRQLEMKRKEMSELAGLMKLEDVKKEVENEKSLERWARKCTHHFTKTMRTVYEEEIDNMVWCGRGKEISEWCTKNKVYDEMTKKEIEEIWQREGPDEDGAIRLNGKNVWEVAKRVCDFINAERDLINITSFSEYRVVMKKAMRVIKEAHNVERKRRRVARKKKRDGTVTRTQRAKSLICCIKRKGMRREEIEKDLMRFLVSEVDKKLKQQQRKKKSWKGLRR